MNARDRLMKLAEELALWAALREEQGVDTSAELTTAREALEVSLRALKRAEPRDWKAEPNALAAIQRLRPAGKRDLRDGVNRRRLSDQLTGAWLGRAAGCTLGVPVEAWPVGDMERLARLHGIAFPPEDYWPGHPWPDAPMHGDGTMQEYLRGRIRHAPMDDDLAYTVLGLLILEEFGPDFTTADVADAWQRYLPLAYTAEETTLANLKRGVVPTKAGGRNNPYQEWIGADIRSDPWGYANPGWPERAAAMAWRDACLSHRRTGVYGAMFFSAAIAAAFVVETPIEALRIGLQEIPARCRLARDLRWSFKTAPTLSGWREARAAVDRRFAGMNLVHTSNNACLTVFALQLGGGDFTRTIGTAVAMGLDNDCTAATAGSILGAIKGKGGIPHHWWKPFRNRARTYLIGQEWWSNTHIVERFARQAESALEI